MTSLSNAERLARGHPLWAEIDLGAIRHNIRLLTAAAGGAEVMGVVKGYAYGHGNPASAKAMLEAGATRLGVARVAEGIHLRQSGISAPIHVFTEPPPEAVATIIDLALTPSVYTMDFARALSDAADKRVASIPVHLKLDTGMHRVGVPPEEVLDAVAELRRLPGLEIEGVWSHLAVADIPDHPFTKRQLDLFSELSDAIEGAGVKLRYRHIANSAAVLSLPASRLDLVRCGVACYGLWPGPAFVGVADLRPVLSLRARVNLAKWVSAGERLSYGLNYELARSGRVLTIPVGYADGYDRRLSNRGEILVAGRRFRVSGTVCMDQFMVDAGDASVQEGAIATLIGSDGDERITAEEIASQIDTINYEVTARIPSRVPRIYLNEDER
ncbi:MAG: alanine racemase [Actinomycetota bacterium]|nr:alanine racemase [Actinomycetota bacterium]